MRELQEAATGHAATIQQLEMALSKLETTLQHQREQERQALQAAETIWMAKVADLETARAQDKTLLAQLEQQQAMLELKLEESEASTGNEHTLATKMATLQQVADSCIRVGSGWLLTLPIGACDWSKQLRRASQHGSGPGDDVAADVREAK